MKLTTLANNILKESLELYKSTKNRSINGDYIYDKYSNLDANFINDAFKLLESDHLISCFIAEMKVWNYNLNLSAIKSSEESSLSKTYKVLKELRDWIPGF